MKRPEGTRRRAWTPSWLRWPTWPSRPAWTHARPWQPRLPNLVRRRITRADLRALGRKLGARWAVFHRRRAARRLAVGGAVTAVLGVGLVAVVYGPPVVAAIADHPYFAVSEIVVTPTHHVRAGWLLESADLRPGVSLWRVDPETLTARLEAHPWIRRATVRREFPRRLIVDLTERQPAAILFLDQLYYVDSTGLAFVRVGERDPLDLPFVTGVEAAIVADERPFARHAIRQALRLLQLMPPAGLPFRVSEVHIDREQGITVFPIEPRVALTFGWSGFGSKLTRLTRVLQDFRGRENQIREIDLTMGAAAVVRLRQPGARGKRTRA
jgi:cell division protein FtsQ